MTTRKAVYVLVQEVTFANDSMVEVFHDVTADHDKAAKWLQEDHANRRVIKKFVEVRGA